MDRDFKILVPLMAMAMLVAIVNAAVFGYYPITLSVTGVQPIQFEAGTNAGNPDLGDGNTIVVTLGPNLASADITLHPTYHKTYYKNVLKVNNLDSVKSYYIGIKVNTALSGFTIAKMHVYDSTHTTLIGSFDLTTTGADYWYGPLSAGSNYIIDFEFVYPEGSPLPSGVSASIELIFSPQNTEAPQ